MLDENLPTFRFTPASDNPLSSILYFSQNGSEPAPEYVLRRPDRSLPAARNKYAIALCDPYSPAVVYGEILIDPEWSQPTLSAAEVRAQQQSGAPPAPAVPIIPDSFTVLLYNPDLAVTVKTVTGSWGKSDSWEFELPTQTFRLPSSSALDRERGNSATAAELVPKLIFRWKKDGRLSKDMSCFMSGTNVGGKKSKEPDITVALFKAARESAVTVYEPNMQRVEVEDRKGWEVVILLAAEAIKDLYLMPKQDIFNVTGAPVTTANGGGRKNSRPTAATPPAMSGALGNIPATPSTAANAPPAAASTPEVEAETRRLKAMVEREEREREQRDRAEQKRIKKMLEEEDRARRQRQAEVDKETERLRREFGMEGQNFPTNGGPGTSASPPLPPRTQNQVHFAAPPPGPPPAGGGGGGWWGVAPSPRPVSVGPAGSLSNLSNSWWRGPVGNPAPQQPPPPQQSSGRRRNGSGGLGLQNPAASVSGFFGLGKEDDRNKVKKKRSMHW